MDDDLCIHVDTRALNVDGLASLGDLLMDGVIHLAEPALGMAAGHWRVGAWHCTGSGRARDLRPISDEEAAAYAAEGRTIHEARTSPAWTSPFSLVLEGMR
ncbi:hypothetical protein ACWD4N_47020, partial [Streptomyces sp. NPDC002586]